MTVREVALLFLFAPALLVAAPGASAQCVQILEAEGVDLFDDLGTALAIDGVRALVGAPGDEADHTVRGALYVFELVEGGWVESARLSAHQDHGDRLGYAAALDGDVAVGGAPTYSGSDGPDAAYVFERVAGAWGPAQALRPTELGLDDDFGMAVAVEGSTLVVTARSRQHGPSTSGSLWVFERASDGWEAVQELLPPPGVAALGLSVGISGDVILGGGGDAVVIYRRTAGVWSAHQTLEPDDPDIGQFGSALDVDGDRAVIGVPVTWASGRAFVYEQSGGLWYERAELIARDGPGGSAQFGNSVAISGSRVLVGARYHDVDGIQDQGEAYLFHERGGNWTHSYALFDAMPAPYGGWFGGAVAIDGSRLMVGSPNGAHHGSHSGGVSAFTFPDSALTSCFCFNDPPCGNQGPMAGCANSTGEGALLRPCGSDSVGLDDLVFSAEALPPAQAALLFAGDGETELAFGDGRLCAGGSAARLQVSAVDPAGLAGFGPGLADIGGFTAGELRVFQVWYRDPQGPCGSGFNTSSGVVLRYAP